MVCIVEVGMLCFVGWCIDFCLKSCVVCVVLVLIGFELC